MVPVAVGLPAFAAVADPRNPGPRATLPRIETQPRDPQDPAGKGRAYPGGDEVIDHREDLFGPTTSRARYADAYRRISISAA